MAKSYYYGGIRKDNRPRYKFLLLFFLIVLIFIVSFVLYMITTNLKDYNIVASGKSLVTESKTIIEAENAEIESQAVIIPAEILPVNPVPENITKDFSYFNDCVFVGDSLTYGLASYNIIPSKDVVASIGLNIDQVDSATVTTVDGDVKIIDAIKKRNPKNIYIMLGSNGIAWLSTEHMIEKYSNFIDEIQKIQSESNIYILSIPPVTIAKETLTEGQILNTSIDSYNSELLKLANEKNIYFVDTNTALKGNDGKLSVDRAAKDGMHFQKDTYNLMLDYILTHTVKEKS